PSLRPPLILTLSPYTTLFRSMVIVGHVPVVDDEAARALQPDVDRTRSERLFLPCLERGAVHAVRHAIVLPREVIEPLADETAVEDRKSTRLTSSHQIISYAVF